MGTKQSKIRDPNANVINNIEVVDHTSHLNAIWDLVMATLIISLLHLVITLYLMHKRSLRKRYSSRADNLDKI